MGINSDTAIQVLTAATLAGLLFSSGLGLTIRALLHSVRNCRIALVLLLNFIFTPAVAFALAWFFALSPEETTAFALLAAAPFAPVVPTFTRLARGNHPLAAALTGTVPLISVFLTPVICETALVFFRSRQQIEFDAARALLILFATITLPLIAGMLVNHRSAAMAARLVKPIQVISEATGALALAVAVISERDELLATGARPLLAVLVLFELSFILGFAVGGPRAPSRFVIASGSANRNIALALMIAVQSFPGSQIAGFVVAYGLAMILLGLVHVGFWRILFRNSPTD